ncbi:DEAD/DEAH box helicase [Thalassotalea sp. HSM 43]|uniref:DEAD/DEAH box helicase n=1 Tax=Thalassotalea sp. HSM 43 TaxID=2552945 RepID=UPI001081C5FB|nr:DEAD/DEAH box helicase [Thalassotalea sp. HSM 43]QBY05112.1 DEAD/DEAH box helicase [Thalassotalea sp. HSM 43]
MSFETLGLSPQILSALQDKGYTTPSPIQEKAIPAVLSGQDVMAAAQTGTGKTAGFTLPILQTLDNGKQVKPNHIRTLILTPTRELAAQVGDNVATYSKNLNLSSFIIYGGVKINPQMMRLRKGIDILVATPGRLLDLYQQNAVKFSQVEVLVLDEADRMLDMGFINDIEKIIRLLPKKRQNLLFSATFSDDIRALARGLVKDPVEISVSPANTTATTVEQKIVTTDKKKKPRLLSYLIGHNNWQQVLVFTKTKHGANRLTRHLEEDGIKALAIHGNKSQGARTKALAQFKDGGIRVLVATDIAARGIDINELEQVVNFDLPHVAEDYVHRIGRTGRAGKDGNAISLVCSDEYKQLVAIERLTQKLLEREEVAGFEAANPVPKSHDIRPFKDKKPKKPKKPKAEHHDGQKSSDNARGHKPVGKNKRHTSKDNPYAKNTSGKARRRPAKSSNQKSSSSNSSKQKSTGQGRGGSRVAG